MKSLAIVFAFLLGIFQLPLMAGDSAPNLQLTADKARQLIADIDTQIARIDRSQFDIGALLDKLSWDEAQIIAFVRDEIAFEDYTGVLRGAEGALTSRAGNSLDQAILLAKILKDAGLDARIAEGVLPQTILSGLVVQKRAAPPGIFQTAASNAHSAGSDPVEVGFDLPKEVADTVSQLQKALLDHGIDMASVPKPEPQHEAAYFWVEYRVSASGPWSPVHPAFANGNTPPEGIKPVRYFAESIPEELQQRISIQAFIERSWQGKRETIAVTPSYEYPASNLSGVTFSYSVVPKTDLTAARGERAAAEKLIGESTLFIPMFDFGSPLFGQAFDTAGNTLSAEDAASDKAAIFQTVGGRFGEVADALDSGGPERQEDQKPSRYVTRHWLEIIIRKPGQAPRKFTRDIARWDGDETAFKLSVTRTARFRVETGAVAPAEFLDRYLRGLKATVDVIAQGRATKNQEDPGARFSADAEVFLLTSDIVAKRNKGEISYRGEPAVVARYHPYGRVDEGREGFDIVSAPREVISTPGGKRHKAGSLLAGVTDTWLEYKLFAGESWPLDSAFEKLVNRSGALNLVTEKDASTVDRIPEPGRQFVRQDLDNGELVLFPGEAAACDSWWRVDPATGNALGMLGNGWGGAETNEYIANLTIMYGKGKVGAALLTCTSLVAFISASAVMEAWSLFQLDEALGHQGLDLCSQMPTPDMQVLCSAVMFAAAQTAATGVGNISSETLKYLCLRVIFS